MCCTYVNAYLLLSTLGTRHVSQPEEVACGVWDDPGNCFGFGEWLYVFCR